MSHPSSAGPTAIESQADNFIMYLSGSWRDQTSQWTWFLWHWKRNSHVNGLHGSNLHNHSCPVQDVNNIDKVQIVITNTNYKTQEKRTKINWSLRSTHVGEVGRVECHDPGECWRPGAGQPYQGTRLAANLEISFLKNIKQQIVTNIGINH